MMSPPALSTRSKVIDLLKPCYLSLVHPQPPHEPLLADTVHTGSWRRSSLREMRPPRRRISNGLVELMVKYGCNRIPRIPKNMAASEFREFCEIWLHQNFENSKKYRCIRILRNMAASEFRVCSWMHGLR